MRKKSLKSLNLNKKSIASFHIVGGSHASLVITTHSISWCNLIGCPSEFITACDPSEDDTSLEYNTTGSVNCAPQSLFADCTSVAESIDSPC
ncbi:hypothetical protein [uncultured Kordia sp.]|uniref:hypothetical protein n=1 Tax=uncultured Kordia sp. TaxID=507699 RepID=UPI0026237EA8|nr:hypothetical protein [uncultured Kordia sp.]